MIEVSNRDGLGVFSVRVSAGSRRNTVGGHHDGALKVFVTQAPEKGKANEAVIRLLAQSLKTSKSQLQIISGETARHKTIAVSGLSQSELVARLHQVVGS